MKTQWIALLVAALVVLVLVGCDGTGGVGGQGICLKDNSDCTVTITITDGGTGLPNPSAGLRASPLPAVAAMTDLPTGQAGKTPPNTSDEPSPAAP